MKLILSLFGMFIGGAGLGLGIAAAAGVSSPLGEGICLMLFPVVFGLTMVAWFWSAIVILVSRLVLGLLRRKPQETLRETLARTHRPEEKGIPGSFVAIPLSVLTAFLAGIILMFSDGVGLLGLALFFLSGAAYGGLFWILGRNGWIMPPEEI